MSERSSGGQVMVGVPSEMRPVGLWVRILRRTVLPVFLIAVCPPTAILIWYTNTALGGSVRDLVLLFAERGVFGTLWRVWRPIFFGTPVAWAVIGIFATVQLLFLRLLPGRTFQGPVTPKGEIPVYKANGVLAFVLTVALFLLGAYGLGLFSPTIVYDNLGAILSALNVFSLPFCLVLYLKGRFAPSGPDHGTSGNVIFDYYWGTELYPKILGTNVKVFTNCRFGMMSWPILLLSFAAKQHVLYGLSDSMAVAVAIQLVYIAKFFYWEPGYLHSLDIMHDRAGFYICWGVLVWVPSLYTASTLYLVRHPNQLGAPLAIGIFVLGVASVLFNFMADAQRQRVRATKGECTVWGKAPVLIVAPYMTEKGEPKESLLLASGFWGLSRHFHYVPELCAAFLWTVPALFTHALPYLYFVFLLVLLTDRAHRDDRRCAAKYGKAWDTYCARVRFKILPGVL